MKNREKIDNSSCVLALDAGGRHFKSALVGAGGTLVTDTVQEHEVDSNGSQQAILSVYEDLITQAFNSAKRSNTTISGMSIATPGPFDFRWGQSMMTHKFQSLYKLDLAGAIRQVAGLPPSFDIRFISNANAFIKGENWQGSSRGFNRVMGVTLGAGLGFACSIDGTILLSEVGGPRFDLFTMKYGNGILEDRISRRGIINAYRKLKGTDPQVELRVQEIVSLARVEKDKDAVSVFYQTGSILLDYLQPICNTMKIECILFGGPISKAFDLIEPGFQDINARISTLKRISPATSIDNAVLLGAASLFY